MANLQRYILPACLVLSIGAMTVGCDDAASSRDGDLKVNVIGWGPGLDGTLGFQAALPSLVGAQVVRVSLTHPATGRLLESETFPVTQKNGRLPKLKNGEGLRMQFDLLDANWEPMAYGATPLFSFDNSNYVQNFRIQVDPVNDFAPVGAVLSGALSQTTFDGRAIRAMGLERWLGRVGHGAVTIEGGNKALIVGGGDAISPVRAGAEPSFRAFHDDLMKFDANSGYFSDLSYNPETNGAFPNGGDRLAQARAHHTVTAIGDDKFLVIGGYGEASGALTVLDSIELIDLNAAPGSRVQTLTDAEGWPLKLSGARVFHSATYRPADNSVVVAGGVGSGGPTDVLASVEIIKLDSNSVVPGSALSTPRAQHEAVLMGDNQTIWVLGGRDSTQALSSTSTISISGSVIADAQLNQKRYGFRALRASDLDGSVVVAIGGFTDLSGTATGAVELGKVGRSAFNACSTCALGTPRGGLQAIELPNTLDIVVLGGRGSSQTPVSGAEVLEFNSLTEAAAYTTTPTNKESADGRTDSSATLLSNGKVLLSGGFGSNSVTLRDAEYFTPSDFVAETAAPQF